MAKRAAPVGAPRETPTDDLRRRLEALRDRLEGAISEAGNRDLAPLAGRYQAVIEQLAGLPAVLEVDAVDDLAAARAARRSSPKGQVDSTGS